MAKCEKENCPHEATHSVTLNIPAKGVPIDLHSPIKMYVGVEMCLEHAKSFGDGFSWDDNVPLREGITASLAASGHSDADFDRTFHSTVRITDEGYKQFLKVKQERTLS